MRTIYRSLLSSLAIGALAASAAAAQQAKTATPQRTSAHQATQHRAKRETQAQLRTEVKVTEKAARATALAQVPGGKVQSSKLEREAGKLVYSYDIKVAGKPGVEEVLVDATTGTVVRHEHETPKRERAEAKKEAKEAKKP